MGITIAIPHSASILPFVPMARHAGKKLVSGGEQNLSLWFGGK
jgi:hypothetical protein